MVKSAQMVKLSAWVLPDPQSTDATLAGVMNRVRAWLDLFDEAHPEDWAMTEDLIKQIERLVPRALPGPSKPVEPTPPLSAVSPASPASPTESLPTERLPSAKADLPSLPQEETLSTPPSTALPASTNKSLLAVPTQLAEEKAITTGPAPDTDLPMGNAMDINESLDISKPADENSKVPVSPAPPVESLQSERLPFAKTGLSSLPQTRALPAPPSTVLPVPANKSLPAKSPPSAKAKAFTTRPKTALPASANKSLPPPVSSPDSSETEEEKEEDKEEEKKENKSSSFGGSLVSQRVAEFKARAQAKARARARATYRTRLMKAQLDEERALMKAQLDEERALMKVQLDEERAEAKEVDEPKGMYGQAVKKILAEIPLGACNYARGSLKVTLKKDAYECLASSRWLNGGVAIALLSLLDPPPHMQVLHVDTVTDPKTRLLVRNGPKTIHIDEKVTNIFIAHCSNDHWVTIRITMGAKKGPFFADWYCSLGRPYDEDVMSFYTQLIERSLRHTGAMSDEFSGEWISNDGGCARQPKGDSNNCGIYTLYNITCLVDGRVPSSDDELDPEKQRWLFARQISEYVTTHDPLFTPSNSPLLCPIDTLTLTNYPTSTEGEGNDVKGKGKMTLEEDNQSPADTDLLVGNAMDMDEPLDISKPMDKGSKVPVSPASPTSPSPMPVQERKDRLVVGFARRGRGIKRSEATRSDEDVMEVEAVSKRRKQSSTATPGPTTASVPTRTDQTPSRATSPGFAPINQPSSPSPTRPTVDLVQSEAPSSGFRRPATVESIQRLGPVAPLPPSTSRTVDPIQREAIFKAMDQHVLTEGASNSLRDLVKWHFQPLRSGIERESSQNPLSRLQIGPSNPTAATAATFKEASRLIYHDIGQNLLSELVRRYHLAIFVRQFEQRKKALEEYYSTRRVPGVRLAKLVNDALVSETVFPSYSVIKRHMYRGSIWLGLAERFGFAFLALVDLNTTKAQFEDHAQMFEVRELFPDYIISKHTDVDMNSIQRKVEEVILSVFSGKREDQASTMAKQEEISQLITPTKKSLK